MASGLSGFVNAFAPSLYSTNHRVEVREITQGGNHVLAASPTSSQAMWGGVLMELVTGVSTGPIYAIAQLFRVLFHPIVAVPLSIVSCAVKERFYESSVQVPLEEQTKYYERGEEVEASVQGTVSLLIDGQMRHFILGNEINWMISNSVVEERDGSLKRFYFSPLRTDEVFDQDCREMVLNGERVRVRLRWEVEEAFTAVTIDGQVRYYKLGNEVAEPVQPTFLVEGEWPHHYPLGRELQAEAPNCIKLHTSKQTLHYDTGNEIDGPTDTSRKFVINGQVRHFASAKHVSAPSMGISGMFNKIPKLPFKLPTRLSRFAIRTLELVNRHASGVIRVSLIVAAAVLLFFGHTAMAAGAFFPVVYEYLDHDLGVIPARVSLIMEKYMPTIAMVGLLIVGSLTSQIMAGATLLLMVPKVNLWIHQKIGKLVRVALRQMKDIFVRVFWRGELDRYTDQKLQGLLQVPSLEEADGPLIERREMTRPEIVAILEAADEAYEVNPAHLTKDYQSVLQLPENSNFTELTRLWDSIGDEWTQPAAYQRLLHRLIDDKRFILFIQERFPEAKLFFFEPAERLSWQQNITLRRQRQAEHTDQFAQWVQIIAQERGFGNEREFIAAWVKQQLECYVGKISGNRPIEGGRRLWNECIQNTAKIIPFLLQPTVSRVDKEDALVKLAIEGGNYCTLAMKRASSEVLQGFAEPLEKAAEPADPNLAFEMEVRSFLQQKRLLGLQEFHQGVLLELSRRESTRDTAADIHLYEAVMRVLKRGFYPLNPDDMANFSLLELLIKETFGLPVSTALMEQYADWLPQAMNQVGSDPLNERRNRVLEYLRAWVEGNHALSDEDKRLLLNGSLANGDEQLADHDNYPKWRRLMLNVLGIWRAKSIAPAPAPAPAVQPVLQLVPAH